MQDELKIKEAAHSAAVREMFAGIAGKYDFLNHFLSLNIDKGWRSAVSLELQEVLVREDAVVLDVACGTGDLSVELDQKGVAQIIAIDFCRPMLAVADKKFARLGQNIPLIESDAMSLPFPDGSFDAVTIAFGLRNLPNFKNGLIELRRVLSPGGKLAVLEFSAPAIPGIKSLFNLYFTQILPRIGGAVSGSRGAYEYLPDSVSKFPDQKRLVRLLEETGFLDVRYRNLTGGIAALHSGTKS